MFAKGFEKTAGFPLKTIVGALEKREDSLGKALSKATKGHKREMEKFLPRTRWMTQQVKVPLSKEIKAKAIEASLHPDTYITGLKKDPTSRHIKERLLDRKLEHAKILQERTRNPMKTIKEEVDTRARRKKHYADAWKDVSKELSGKIKKARTTKAKSKSK